jgi:hypothetical protein
MPDVLKKHSSLYFVLKMIIYISQQLLGFMQRKRMLIVTSDDLNHSHINNDLSGVNHLVDFHFCDYKGFKIV